MNRLLQGDVGSGKTVIAALAIAMVTRHGAQAALMAPTSILAEQHYKSMLVLLATNEAPPPAAQIPLEIPVVEQTFMEVPLSSDLEQAPEPGPTSEAEAETGQPPVPEIPTAPRPPAPLQPSEIRLMIGATPEAEKQEIRAGLAEGKIKLVVGTHALIEEPVTFSNLELTIVDEQHRFGVEQRAALRSKGTNPHLLVMTATPIPRSLALTVYGDLDLAVIDEMPPGRQPVNTHVLTPRERERAYSLIRSQVEKGRQAFIIYPLVEESDKSDSKAAVEEYARLQSAIFPKLKLGLLHGRMRPEEKDEVMGRFRAREIHVLVSTSVVEVGMDIPDATVMLIEGADHWPGPAAPVPAG
jgi:ATP-dependent DNA helicase RecG